MQANRFVVFLVLTLSYFAVGIMAKKVAGLVVFRRTNDTNAIEYLMLKPKSNKKKWSPPKGRVDDGEDFFTAAVRETHEETRYTVGDLNIHMEHNQAMEQPMKKGKKKTVKFWLAELKDGNKQPKLSHEHSEYRWMSKEDAILICDIPEFTEILNEFDGFAKTL
ncbi:bis(5'-nucleosyl)-tetraphosphatase [asymmetrical]-like [Contarinia nasturtii]|uniref:bis(5'-nucleosyl)-tetraphosphatase [asymmetrical]-like n=1 Tax=Contarinia nasturtii TaxID=265458 RepID=UPI0012D3E82C|nr:bis(5'-nucleosyl)-tetraphosphatase [asymmetrical]-like [Contarinia nasturtii]